MRVLSIKEKVLELAEEVRAGEVVMFERYVRKEERGEREARLRRNAKLIEYGDPECERVIAALEEGWSKEGR